MSKKRYSNKLEEITEKEEVSITELILYNDLLLNYDPDLGVAIGLGSEDKIYEKAPKKCSCGGSNIVGLEVLGACDEILFWLCDDCDKVYLTRTFEKTKKLLEVSKKFWTVPSAWPIPPLSERN